MSNQPRVAKVLAALLVSMTIGAIILMALGNNPPSAGPFCLSNYYRLDSIEKAIFSETAQSPHRWNSIEIYYSATKAGNVEQLASLNGLTSPEDLNYHFVVCNGLGGDDGEIQSTEKWQKQWSIIPGQTWYGSGQAIRICVIADNETVYPTNTQVKRVDALIEKLSRKFNIPPDYIYYPNNWE
ncbi:MAG: N-acetylmuramoyl-L-alanine amidase [Phycisphaerae bacterium]|nr:N-acetylmuramoyl-L-alanine amidase [Phycisphaerae bacterium]